jgi:hypothetical protein
MKHARSDYDSIQPWPTKRPHHFKTGPSRPKAGRLIMDPSGKLEHQADDQPIIPDDEPVFLIRGQDRAAIPAAEAWCAVAEGLGADAGIIATVRRHIEVMREWQASHPTKVPDAPAEALR